MSPILGYKCVGTGGKDCDETAERTKDRSYRRQTTCETCYRPTDQEPWNICSECEKRHPAPKFVQAYKGQLDPDTNLPTAADHQAVAEESKPGITEKLRKPTEAHQQLIDRIAAHGADRKKPEARDNIQERIDKFRTEVIKPPLPRLSEAEYRDPRDRIVNEVRVLRLKQHASLLAARMDNKRAWPAHLHSSLVKELDEEYKDKLSPKDRDIVEDWLTEFLNVREKARSDA